MNTSSTLKALAAHFTLLSATLRSAIAAPVSQVWNTLTGKQTPLLARITHRYAIPSTRSISVAEGFFGFIPIESYENEKYILEVAHGDQKYQVEVPHTTYHAINIGDHIDIHTH
ncbi:hypothetical protein [Edaphovirga cremea]|uniref:hypothetical protein n=1 Tax=Edaphovirga cremea TaxID=2267246 RepID=UPI003989946E